MNKNPLDQLRAICLALPNVEERLSHGEPTWFVRGKRSFVMFSDRHHDDRVAFWCAAPPGAQQVMMESAPAQFFSPPYVGCRGWLGVWLDVPVDWSEIEEIVVEAYRAVAPPPLRAKLDHLQPDST